MEGNMVYLKYKITQDLYEVYVARDTRDGGRQFLTVHPDGRQVWSETRPRDEVSDTKQPTICIPASCVHQLLREFQVLGVRPPDVRPPDVKAHDVHAKTEGLYEAQSKHLADLQIILRRLLPEPPERMAR